MILPGDVGLPEDPPRRSPGLRRHEVADLAGVSADYYTRFEQARASHPSAGVVAALARALRCDPDERDHLYRLAGLVPPPRPPVHELSPSLLRLAEQLRHVPCFACTALTDLLWQNDLATTLFGRFAGEPGRRRNAMWRWFTDAEVRARFHSEDRPRLDATHVMDLRAVSARSPSAEGDALVSELSAASEDFRTLWARHEVREARLDRRRIIHPVTGVLDLMCQFLQSPDGLRVVTYFPATDAARAGLDLLLGLSGDAAPGAPRPRSAVRERVPEPTEG